MVQRARILNAIRIEKCINQSGTVEVLDSCAG